MAPEQWYKKEQYHKVGHRLPEGTGAVYRVPTWNESGRRIDLVVKFSRFAQDVMLNIKSDYPCDIIPEDFYNACFNGPFKEFGVLMELRNSNLGSEHLRIRTKKPFAIYCPSKECELWRLGRTLYRFSPYQKTLAENQTHIRKSSPVELNINKQYVLLFGWVKGENAAELCSQSMNSK